MEKKTNKNAGNGKKTKKQKNMQGKLQYFLHAF